MAKIAPLAQFIVSFDGGVVNDGHNDVTGKGVTTETLHRCYWNHWRADNIKDQSIANILVDWVCTSGTPGIAIIQAMVGVKANGIADKRTIAAINRQEPTALFNRIKACRKQFIESIVKNNPSQERFLDEWLRRLESINYGSLIDSGGNTITW